MNQSPMEAIRVVAVGQFPAALPPLAPRLRALHAHPVRCAEIDLLPTDLNQRDVLLTDMNWLNALPSRERDAFSARARQAGAWIALTEGLDRFKDMVTWQRAGLTHFFRHPLDPDRLAAQIEDMHDRLGGPPVRAILLDDDQASLAAHAAMLEGAGVEVLATSDPLMVLEVLEEHRPDVLVVDIEMPGCRGTELLTILRQQADYAGLPAIYLTAHRDIGRQLQARATVAEDILTKPVAAELLVAAVTTQAWRYRSRQRADKLRAEREARSRGRLEQLRQAIDAHAIVSIADRKGDIIYVNDKFCAISGFSRQELLGQNHRMVKSSDHPKEFYRELWSTISSGRTWHGEVCNLRKDGGKYWVEATIVPILDGRGRAEEYISIRTDITQVKEQEEQARTSDERLRRSQAFANIGTWDWNIQTGELYWSERIAPLFGYSTGELETSYENFLNAIHPEDRQAVVDAVGASVERDAPYEIEHRVVWPDGQVRWLLERGAVVRAQDGTPLHMLGVVQDIDDRKQAELALAESEQRLRQAQAMAHLGNWEADVRTGRLIWSEEIFHIFGHDPETFVPSVEAFFSAVHPDDVGIVQESEKKAEVTGIHDVVHRIVRPDGTVRHVHELARGERDETGNVVRLLGTVQDITEQVQAKERLALFRRIFDASEQAVGITDSEGRMIYLNRAHEEMLGYSQDEMVRQPFSVFLPEDERGRVVEEVMTAVSAGRKWVELHRILRKDGSTFVAASNVGFVKDDKGNIQYLFNIFSDFSGELARRAELAEAKELAERANQAKSDFLSSMSHELRTPMNAIIGFAQMLEYDDTLNADQQDNVTEILKAGRHLLELINEVLDLAKVESGRITLSIEDIELAPVGDECCALIQPLANVRGVTVEHALSPGMLVRADRVRLKQALLNLLSNAVKYNRDRGHIRLCAAPGKDNRLRIEVADTGPGIPADRLGELFQPFNRLEAEGSTVEGTGIGLTITRRIIEMMGGDIGVDSEVGVGSTFWFELPADATAVANHEEVGESGLGGSVTASRQYHVLCIDDNPANLKLIARILGMRGHIHLTTAHQPDLGIELALAHRPDLILLDINMPTMDGYRVLEVLKAEPRLRDTPVVAITANALQRDIERGLAAGFADYLTKPLDIARFLDSVDHLLTVSGDRHDQ